MKRVAIVFLVAWFTPCLASAETVQNTFEFHSSFWLNLHHTFYNQAAGKKVGRAPDLAALSPAELAAWNEALDYYDRNIAAQNFLDLPMIRINMALAASGNAPSLKGVPEPLAQLLEKAAPAYRAHWWPAHDRKNREWIDRVEPLIAQYENVLKPALAHAYNTSWPKGRIHVEMSCYTTGASGYTSLWPTIITISSWSMRNEGPAAVETVFHEAGHSLVQKIQHEMEAAEKKQGRKLAHPDLWHAMMFYTTGELVQQQVPSLVPYAKKYGMWGNNWPNSLPIMEKDWQPYLDGKAGFRDSIQRVVADSD